MIDLESFYQKYPQKEERLPMGKTFRYRYFKNPEAKATLVLLTGGIGLSDLFCLHFERFAEQFSVLTFDYQLEFADNREFAGAVAQMLDILDERVWLVGQSLGGIVAQIIAANYPERVEGLVLSNTCSLAADMEEDARSFLEHMLKEQKSSKRLLAFIPFPLFKRLISREVMKKKAEGFSEEEMQMMKELCSAMERLLTKKYEFHMIDFLIDAKNHRYMQPKDFQKWKGRVLLILSQDDHTFSQPCIDSLINLMPDPTVITDITGGHLALLVRIDQYTDTVTRYITDRAS